ncbi:MAG TPA: MFS transporter, partial [Acetobacteraceae bacterium]|nr:MFS transporter [Acetobacteraceae bacterium]
MQNPLRRMVPQPSRAAVFLGLLAVAAWLDNAIPESPPLPETRPSSDTPKPAMPQQDAKPWYRPFEGSYAASLTSAIVALSPFIVVTTAHVMFGRQVVQDVHASRTASSIIAGLSVAGYAWGALLGGDLVQRFRQRRMFIIAELLFALGCLLAAIAHAAPIYAAGRVLTGFGTG